MRAKPQRNRKEKARNAVFWLILLILFLRVTGAYCFTPEQAVEKRKEQYILGEAVDVVSRNDGLLRRYTLCANSARLALIGTEFGLLEGWKTNSFSSFDRDREKPLDCCFISMKENGDDRKIYVYGAVNDGRISYMTIVGKYIGDVKDFDKEVAIPWTDAAEYPDAAYFITDASEFYDTSVGFEMNSEIVYPTDFHIITYDESGTVLDIIPIENEIWAD